MMVCMIWLTVCQKVTTLWLDVWSESVIMNNDILSLSHSTIRALQLQIILFISSHQKYYSQQTAAAGGGDSMVRTVILMRLLCFRSCLVPTLTILG